MADSKLAAALVNATMHTPGWEIIKQAAYRRVGQAIDEALNETDRDKGEFLRIKAAAMRDGFSSLWAELEMFAQSPDDSDGFGDFEPQKIEKETGINA